MRRDYLSATAGFTLVELLLTQALGLALISVLVASLSSLYKSIQVSADAAENGETAYFLMDALAQWLSESRRLPLSVDSFAGPVPTLDGGYSAVINDPCETPLRSPFAFSEAGVAVVPAGNVSCLPSPWVDDHSPVLMIERRMLCPEDCADAGFYVAVSDCSPGRAVLAWRSGDGDIGGGDRESGETRLETCNGKVRLFQLHRMLIYSRDYSRKRGDGVPALMMSRLAPEPESRWLRSDMLASGVFDWGLRCASGCDLSENRQAQRSNALLIEFSVKGRYRSTAVERTVPVDIPW